MTSGGFLNLSEHELPQFRRAGAACTLGVPGRVPFASVWMCVHAVLTGRQTPRSAWGRALFTPTRQIFLHTLGLNTKTDVVNRERFLPFPVSGARQEVMFCFAKVLLKMQVRWALSSEFHSAVTTARTAVTSPILRSSGQWHLRTGLLYPRRPSVSTEPLAA